MALRVFGDVAEQDAEGSFQALAADVARFVEAGGGFGEMSNGGVSCFHSGQELRLGGAGFGLTTEERELFGG